MDNISDKKIKPEDAEDSAGPSNVATYEDEVYSMAYGKHGLCLIFNNETFHSSTEIESREGSGLDTRRLQDLFEKLEFDVKVHSDLTKDQLLLQIEEVSKEDLNKYSSLVIIVMTHGDLGVLCAADKDYACEEVYQPFSAKKCSSLVGKPKIFLFQACMGTKRDSGVKVKVVSEKGVETDDYNAETSEDDSYHEKILKIPTWTDFLIVYSTYPGYSSWRDKVHGAWFINELCSTWLARKNELDLLSLLTIVNRRLTVNHETSAPNDPPRDGKKQVALIHSTLTKLIKIKMSNECYLD